jgi:putative restriction endonuclease
MARHGFGAIPAGAPFLFKLRKPEHCIVGGGFFVGHCALPLSMAWDSFGEKNGASSFISFRDLIAGHRATRNLPTDDPEIGCTILNRPFFMDERDWIDAPEDWGNNIVQGKTYSTDDFAGNRVWAGVADFLQGQTLSNARGLVREAIDDYGAVFGNQYLRTARLGQGAFRAMITETYGRRCCVTGETTLPVLEAAHIRPVTSCGDNALTNGLLLRADMHILFDRGLIGISPDYKVRVSSQIREKFVNGRVYYAHEDQPLQSVPTAAELLPSRELLDWHMSEVFVA